MTRLNDGTATTPRALPAPFTVTAADGYLIHGNEWAFDEPGMCGARHRAPTLADPGTGHFVDEHAPTGGASSRPVVVINAATSVRCDYYARFAQFLYDEGFDVLTFDYRGIGRSRPASLRGFQATWSDWGALDFEAVLGYAAQRFPGSTIDVVAHSFGGVAAGLARSAHRIRRVVSVGAQFAYWGDYLPEQRLGMLVKWHLFMPLATALFGYFPGSALGWLEDTPAGVVHDWARRTPQFERRPSGKRLAAARPGAPVLALAASILAISITDDPFGTPTAVDRLLRCFAQSDRTLWQVAPADVGANQIGHFAFFHSHFRDTLWPLALAWLQQGKLPSDAPGQARLSRAPGEG